MPIFPSFCLVCVPAKSTCADGTKVGWPDGASFAILERMAKIFYIGGGSHTRGMLRAVVTLEQLNAVVPLDAVSYIGTTFPENEFDGAATIVEIASNETVEPWATGFSRINASPAEFDERLKFLPEPEKPASKAEKQERRNGSALIHWLTRRRSTCE